MRTEILYEDEDVLVIHKPAGLPTQTAKVGQPDAVSELKNYLAKKSGSKGQPYLGIIHRLDQPVEGLLVFAKNKNAAAALTSQLQKKSEGLNKQYQAIVCGKLPAEEGTLVDYLYDQFLQGSPPHTRGTPLMTARSITMTGITPAYAGNT